jgi:hypothetical protein
MLRTLYLLSFSFILPVKLLCQVPDAKDIVRQFESAELRESFLARLSPQDKSTERLLLAMLEAYRSQLETRFEFHGVRVGLADAFGVMGSEEAIPWLIANITLWRYGGFMQDMNRWNHASDSLEKAFPAVRALVRIGPAAVDALRVAYQTKLDRETQLAIVFALSRMKDPTAKEVLKYVQYDINQLQHFVKEGLAAPASADDVKK